MKNYQFPLSAILLILLVSVGIQTASAGDEKACYERMVSEMVAVHDEWRAQLFGARRGTDGNVTVLTGGETERERTGIFETKKRLTSELVEPLVESYRVYRCRTLAVCQVVTKSLNVDGGSFDLKMLGCAPQAVERFPQCYFAGTMTDPQSSANLGSAATDILRMCQQLASQTLESERAVLQMAVAYDSGYRSLLQFAGIIDWMLQGFPTGTIRVISDMVNMLGKLHQIPCFIGQCDHPSTSDLAP